MSKIVNQLSWMIGGPQGSGVDSAATLFTHAVAASGLWVFGNREYHSNIMGKHSYYRVRTGAQPLQSHADPVHLLATFEPSTLAIHLPEVTADGAIIYDSQQELPTNFTQHSDLKVPIDYAGILAALAKETGQAICRVR